MTCSSVIAKLNDAFRHNLRGGRVLLTPGISDRQDLKAILDAVMTFDRFSDDNDPSGEHDFGAFQHEGDKVFWKIDYYDLSITAGSPDPSDAAATTRVMTIMLAAEY